MTKYRLNPEIAQKDKFWSQSLCKYLGCLHIINKAQNLIQSKEMTTQIQQVWINTKHKRWEIAILNLSSNLSRQWIWEIFDRIFQVKLKITSSFMKNILQWMNKAATSVSVFLVLRGTMNKENV